MRIDLGSAVDNVDTLISKLGKLAEAPEYICCPISQDVIEDPVLLIETGHVFDRKVIQDWLRDHNTCPFTGVELSSKALAPVHIFRSLTSDFKTKFIKKSIPIVLDLLQNELNNRQLLTIKDTLELAIEYSNGEKDEAVLVVLMRVFALLNDHDGLYRTLLVQMDRIRLKNEKHQISNAIMRAIKHLEPLKKESIDGIASALSASQFRIEHLSDLKDVLITRGLNKEAARVCRDLFPMLYFIDRRYEGLKYLIEAITLDPDCQELYEALIKSFKDRDTLIEFCKISVEDCAISTEKCIVSKKLYSLLKKSEKFCKFDFGSTNPIAKEISEFEKVYHNRAVMAVEFRKYTKCHNLQRLSSSISLDKVPTVNRKSEDTIKTEHQIWCVVRLDEHHIATCHQKGGFIRVWDTKNMKSKQVGKGLEGMEYLWEMVPVGDDCLACGSRSFSGLRIFNWKTGHLVNTVSHTAAINSAGHNALLSFGSYVMAALKDNTVAIWDVSKPNGELIRVYRGHKNYVNCIELLPNGYFASGSVDRSVKIWSIDSEECISTISDAHQCGVTSLCLLDEHNLISAGGSDDKKIKIWNLNSLTCCKTLTGHGLVIKQLARLGPNLIASASWDKTVKLWNTITGECIRTLSGHEDQVLGIIVNNDNIISVSKDKSMRTWRYEDDRSQQ